MVSIVEDSIVVNKPRNQDDKELLTSLQEVNSTTTAQGAVFSTENVEPKFIKIRLESGPQGLGFNIVGGRDSPHIPGHSGIFVSIIKSDSPAYNDGKLSVGDLILAVNGIELVNKTHDEAVSIIRSQMGSCVELLVEIGAENRILNEHMTTDTNLSAGKSPLIENFDLMKTSLRPHIRQSYGNGVPGANPSSSYVHDMKGRDEDNESVSSCAPSVHSFLDDVPRTPKKPMSYLDPRNPSLVTEVLYVSIGLAVISLGTYVGYRIIRGRR